ncbi:hypothetical protein MLD38_005183 [Melastoma candidum]|uniref:Uncharacterized protein n=1 Tax=Melastoma candidum TaxID=119954 RepID=A0ACB9S866_9MYRT|nr:hypothetical protein MLD38_005183 [Melastoma candidum]
MKDLIEHVTEENARERFKSLFVERFFHKAMRESKVREFEVLEQGRLTFEQYGWEFTLLSSHASHFIATHAMKARRFE